MRNNNGRLELLVVKDKGNLKFPGGQAEPSEFEGIWEDPEETLFREIGEELGGEVSEFFLIHSADKGDSDHPHTQFFFLTNIWMGKHGGELNTLWLGVGELRQKLLPSHREAFEATLALLRKESQSVALAA